MNDLFKILSFGAQRWAQYIYNGLINNFHLFKNKAFALIKL